MILYFSGTGNTRLCAEYLAKRLGQTAIELTQSKLVLPIVSRDKTPDDMVIWMFPIYSWGIPPVVLNFMKKARIGTPYGAFHHMVATCGDTAGNARKMWQRTMQRRGFKTGRAFTVAMPNTYVLMKGFHTDAAEVVEHKLKEAPRKLDYIADEISYHPSARPKKGDYTKGWFARIKTNIIYPWFVKHGVDPHLFHCKHNCIECGKCSAECPMGNIYVDSHHRPIWTSNCAMCLRCLHNCPVNAITYKTREFREQKGPLPPSL